MFEIDKPPPQFVNFKKSFFPNVMKHEPQFQLWKKYLSVERKFKNSPV